MIRRALLILALIGLAACGAPRQDWPEPSPALWEVTGPDGAHGWLFGTVHALPPGVEWRTRAVDVALEEADMLVVEVAELGDRDTARAAFERLARSSGLPPLSQRVPQADRPALATFMDRAGMDDADFADLESWAAALLLANAARSHGGGNGVDHALLSSAERATGLESFGAQYRMFDRLSPEEQTDLLLGLAHDAGQERQGERLRAWITGDMEKLAEETLVGILADPELRHALLISRNRAWAGRIEALLSAGEKPFIAVGAAHMLGPEGLPALLAERGYRVRRIP